MNKWVVTIGILFVGVVLYLYDPVMVGLCASLAVFFGFFGLLAVGFAEAGEEDARRMAQGKPPKHGPPPFGPNNPFKR